MGGGWSEEGVRGGGRRGGDPSTEPLVVLVVDDEEAMQDSCRQVLERVGYMVEGASTAEEALESLRRLRREGRGPAVALVDLKMPGMGGEEFLRRLRQEAPNTVPVVITGYATVESAVQSMKEGAQEYLAKPFTPAELRAVVDRSAARHRLMQRLHALERDKELMREKFAAMISHQLRSPLVAVAEYLEVLRKGMAGPLNEEQRKILQRMSDRVDHLTQLINDWTLLSSTEAADLRKTAQEVDLEEMVRRKVEEECEAAGEPRPVVEVEVVSPPGKVKGDPRLLGEMLGNLLENALKYTPPEGRVTVRLTVEGSMAVVAVADTGPGIPEAELPFVFEDFYRGQRARSTTGTGLGLPIARRIAELHGGTISVESVEGQGSTFLVRLPRLADQEEKGGDEQRG